MLGPKILHRRFTLQGLDLMLRNRFKLRAHPPRSYIGHARCPNLAKKRFFHSHLAARIFRQTLQTRCGYVHTASLWQRIYTRGITPCKTELPSYSFFCCTSAPIVSTIALQRTVDTPFPLRCAQRCSHVATTLPAMLLRCKCNVATTLG